MKNKPFYHAFTINSQKCQEHLECIRNCPTRALRVHDKRIAFLHDMCIDCGECIKNCPEDVYEPISDSLEDFESYKYHIAVPSNIMYSQFGPDIHPYVVNQALKKIGFDEIAEVTLACAEVGFALKYHLKSHPEIRPLISSFCPSVVRLIQVSFPNLVNRLVPLDVPREIVAREVKLKAAKKLGLKIEEIGVIYISPCNAKIVSIKEPAEKGKSWIDGALPIRDVYNLISREIIKSQQQKTEEEFKDFYFGKTWGVIGHFSQNVGDEKAISVAGINHVKKLLNDLENEKLYNIDFVEALACYQGCISGIFCVKDAYVARHNTYRLHKKFGSKAKIDKDKIIHNYNKGMYFNENPILPRSTRDLQVDIAESIRRRRKKDRIYAKLPKKNCSLCGSPTCETFADDVSRNEADLTDCIFFRSK